MSGRSYLLLSRFRPDHPSGGAALRNWQNIQALSRIGTVDVITVSTHEEPPALVHPVRQWSAIKLPIPRNPSSGARWRSRLRWLRPGIHPTVDQYRQPFIQQALARHLRENRYDVAVVEELSLAAFIPLLKRFGVRVVFDAHNVESVLRAQMEDSMTQPRTPMHASWRRWRRQRLTAEESRAVQSADLIWACSHGDAQLLRTLYRPSSPVDIVPNGIAVEAYQTADAISAGADWSDHPLTLSFLGSYSYAPNEQAALILLQQVLPALRARGERPRLLLIGRDPTEAMQAVAEADPAVTITGSVPSILPYLREPSVVTLPLKIGSGTRLKILEAFAADRPVVSTNKGAEGLEVVDGQHLLLRDEVDGMVDAVLTLWRDRALRLNLCREAETLLAQRYSWEACATNIARSLEPSALVPVQPSAETSSV